MIADVNRPGPAAVQGAARPLAESGSRNADWISGRGGFKTTTATSGSRTISSSGPGGFLELGGRLPEIGRGGSHAGGAGGAQASFGDEPDPTIGGFRGGRAIC